MGTALRFLHFALFNGALASLHYYISDNPDIARPFGPLVTQLMRTSQMVNNYHWLYKRTSILTWTER